MAYNVEPGLGDIVIDRINQEVNSEGEKIIKVTKKKLRKKMKVQGRNKLMEEGEVSYVRINNINVFDYD